MGLAVSLVLSLAVAPAATYPSYYLASIASGGDLAQVAADVSAALTEEGLVVVGRYNPAQSPTQVVLAYTAPELLEAARAVGGLAGFAAVLRVGLEKAPEGVRVSYVNPDYLLRAYYRRSFGKVATKAKAVGEMVRTALAKVGKPVNEPFGSRTDDGKQEPDKTESELASYHYMAMMPYFDDVLELGRFESFAAGRARIEVGLKERRSGTAQVYAVEIPGAEAVLYGVALNDPKVGEPHFLPIVNQVETHVAAMPYELLLYRKGDAWAAVALHGKYRIALHWNALTMGTFMKIMGTPGDIEETLAALVR